MAKKMVTRCRTTHENGYSETNLLFVIPSKGSQIVPGWEFENLSDCWHNGALKASTLSIIPEDVLLIQVNVRTVPNETSRYWMRVTDTKSPYTYESLGETTQAAFRARGKYWQIKFCPVQQTMRRVGIVDL